MTYTPEELAFAKRQAAAEECERCAALLELISRDWDASGQLLKKYAAEYLAREIRDTGRAHRDKLEDRTGREWPPA